MLAICRQPLDGDDLGLLVRDGEGQAAIDAPPVEQDGAGAALPVVAALLGACECEPLAQRIQQSGAGINGQMVGGPVHPQRDFKVHRICLSFGLCLYMRYLEVVVSFPLCVVEGSFPSRGDEKIRHEAGPMFSFHIQG